MRSTKTLILVVTILSALTSSACRAPSSVDAEGSVEQAVWSNGDFESDAIGTAPPTGWTVTSNLNLGITDLRPNPQTLASLNLAAGGTLLTRVVGGAAETQTDPDLGTQGTLRFPKYGQRATRVNSTGAASGSGNNVNSIRQTMTVSLGDVDPVDNKVHVRFAVAPLLENPGHTYTQQPYYFVRLQNLTKGQTIYQDFNASGQPGVPWKNFTDTSGQAAQYTDWQLVDVSPGNSLLAVGDQVELVVSAAGCSQGGHWGRVYVDAVGSGVPGLYSWATGPQAANAGSTITYTLNYKNGGTTTTSGTALDFVTPPNTTFQSVSLGAACTAPAVGGTGTVTCPLGTLANGSTGSFQVTVGIPAGTANGTVILNGNYSIYATGVSALLGPKVFTTVTSSVSYADLGITISDGVAALGWGQPTTYAIDVTNSGPLAASAVTVTDVMPAQLTGVTWTCTASGGGACTASGSGSINDAAASLPVGAQLHYTVAATVIAGSGSGQVVNTATVAVGGGVSDPDSTNNTALDTNAIGTLRTLTLTKTGDLTGGRVSSVPASISCDVGCASDSGEFLDGAQVVLTAAPVAGATFTGWGGACAGTATSCTVTMAGDQSVTAAFLGAPAAISITGGGVQSTTTSTAFASPLQVLVTDAGGNPVPGVTVSFAAPGSGASASLSAGTATTNASGLASVTATANASAGGYSVTATVTGLPPVSFALTNVGLPATITVAGGGTQSAEVATAFAGELVALVRDAASAPVAGATVTFTRPGTGATASLSASTAVTDSSGLARVTATAGTVTGSYSVTATVSGVATPATYALTNTPGAAATITVAGGGTQSAVVATAFAQALAVAVADAHGNAVPGATVSFVRPGSGATASLSASTAVTDSSGQASVVATAGTVTGSYSVTATVSGVAMEATYALTNTPGAAATITVAGGGTQSAVVATAFAQALAVAVADAHGNAVPGATVSFSRPGSGATASLSASTAVTDSSGQASVTATAGTVTGSYSVTATVSGVATEATYALTNTPGAAATITVAGGGTQSAVVATAFAQALAVAVADAHGNAVPGATVSFARPGSGATASLSASTAVTDSSGQASVTATAGTVTGSYSVTATVSGVATPATYALTNTPGAAATITVAGGGTQSAVVATAFAQALAVAVADAHGNAVPGATVSFVRPGSGATASLSASTAVTDSSGQASVTATAGTVTGSQRDGDGERRGDAGDVRADQHAGAAATITVAGGGTQSAVVATAFAQALAGAVADAHGNAVPGATVSFVRPGSGATASLSASTAVTDSSGQASVTATAGTVTGSYSVTATVSGVATPATYALTNTPGAAATITVAGGGTQSAVVATAFAQALAVAVADAHGNRGAPGRR
ncbi:MAG: Ig-like domain-containing protein [Myxococcales bacterium]|nr:Ig-like domain-containing protein [Myxococcales bacterium]